MQVKTALRCRVKSEQFDLKLQSKVWILHNFILNLLRFKVVILAFHLGRLHTNSKSDEETPPTYDEAGERFHLFFGPFVARLSLRSNCWTPNFGSERFMLVWCLKVPSAGRLAEAS